MSGGLRHPAATALAEQPSTVVGPSSAPRLALAVCAKGSPCDPAAFLAALAADPGFTNPAIEIHIAHDGGWPAAITPPPGVRLHACPPGSPVARLWGEAIARAAGTTYIAVLDLHVPPAPCWLQQARAAIAEAADGSVLAFGAVEPGWDADDCRLVGYLAEYAQFKAPVPPELGEVPGNNLVGPRQLLAPREDDGMPPLFFKTFAVWRLAEERGIVPRYRDDMAVVYRKGFAPGPYLAIRLAQGRSFAGRRHAHPGQPPRLLCLAFTPLLPALRLWRIRRAVRRDPALRRAARRHLPLLLLSEAAWSLGEFLGYLAGPAGPEE